MAQLFSKNTNYLAKVGVLTLALVVGSLIGIAIGLYNSPFYSNQNTIQPQPVPFSHAHHVKGLGIDCRYCHTSVEKSGYAGIPSTKTCMTCHSQLWTNAALLEPVREAYRTGQAVQWTKVHNLPDFVYFNHSIHVAKGVACITCHGAVDKMPLMYQKNSLSMRWCLECHRNPQKFIGLKEKVFETGESEPPQVSEVVEELLAKGDITPEEAKNYQGYSSVGKVLVKAYHIKPKIKLADCYTCHR